MTWLDDERSVQLSRPVELYRFTTPGAVFLYTSHVVDVIHGGETYTALPMGRGNVEISPVDPAQLAIKLPVSTGLVQHILLGGKPPPERIDCIVLRYQPTGGSTMQIAEGPVMGWPMRGRECELRVSNRMAEALQTEVGSRRISSQCNHGLYDARCRVDRLDFDWPTTITAIDGRVVSIDTIGALPDDYHLDDWFLGGEMVTAEGERRRIVHVVSDPVLLSADVTLEAEFRTATVSMAVTLYAGCDHSVDTCLVKFDNVVHFGGHPGVPRSNPWLFGLRGDEELQ